MRLRIWWWWFRGSIWWFGFLKGLVLECRGMKDKLSRLIGMVLRDDLVDVADDGCGDPPLLKLELDSSALSRRESFRKRIFL